jgi:hypothetical protein
MVNTWHYDLIDSIVPGQSANDPQSLADRFRDDVIPQWKANIGSAWTLDPVHVVEEFDPQNPTHARDAWDSGTPTAGTKVVSGDQLPSFCAPIARLLTGKVGRRFRGRTWIMGQYLEAEQANGAWTTSFKTGLGTMMAAVPLQPDIASGVSDSTANLCVYSRTQRAADLDPYAQHVTTVAVQSLVHSLRRRAAY